MVNRQSTGSAELRNFKALVRNSNLTVSQLQLWLGQQLNRDTPHYNMAMLYQINGKLDLSTFDQALNEIISQSDGMRMVFDVINQIPQYDILDRMDIVSDRLDFRNSGPEQLENWLQQQNKKNIRFNLLYILQRDSTTTR